MSQLCDARNALRLTKGFGRIDELRRRKGFEIANPCFIQGGNGIKSRRRLESESRAQLSELL